MSLRLQPVQVRSDVGDTDGLFVFAGDVLVAVLVSLSDLHGKDAGRWFLEASFGLAVTILHPPAFVDFDEAQAWITQQLSRSSAGQVP